MRNLIVSLLVVTMFVMVSCDDDDDGLLLPPGASETTDTSDAVSEEDKANVANLTEDEINDVENDQDFQYSTVHQVVFELSLMENDGTSVVKASVSLSTDEDKINDSVSDDNGSVKFNATISKVAESITLTIEHPLYVTKKIVIENIQELSSVTRTIYLAKKEEPVEVTDTDGDGVGDDNDAFPEDPELIGSVKGEYTIAYEDLWPRKGDADFNDLVVRLEIEELINPDNMISKIKVRYKLLAAGAGYKNQLWINILDKDYLLIFNPKKELNGKWNCREKDKYVDAKMHELLIELDNPAERDEIAPMPYDPYIKCNGNNKNQVHLSFVKSKWDGKVIDEDNFPWAVIVPSDWAWPKEKSDIFKSYPEFDDWYKSEGAEFKDWYLHPEVDHVFKVSVGTALTAYLYNASNNMNLVVILGIIGAMTLVLVGLNLRRRKSQGV